jgi:hypothetical protein
MSLLSPNEICYICQEECNYELSPCKCKIPVHQECMNKFRRVAENEDFRTKCSVCNSEYITIPIHAVTDTPIRVNIPTYSGYTSTCKDSFKMLWYIGLYILYGYIGKIIMQKYDDGEEFDGEEYWSPLNAIHLCYALIIHTLVQMLINTVKLLYKRQFCCIIEYEEFTDDENDYVGDYSDDSDTSDDEG